MLYFGFGSNLDLADFARWCAARGHPGARLVPVARAWLPDHELAFHYHSRPRRGGAADVRPRRGAAVPGALFEADEATWRALDHKEGGGRTYARTEVVVLTEDGRPRRAVTYRVTDDYRQDRHVAPTEEYVAIVERGLADHDHPTDHLHAAARSLDRPATPDALFVYGTLLRGEPRADLLERFGAHGHLDAGVGGHLRHLGAYPGLVHGDGHVRGELVRLTKVDRALEVLDEYEGFGGYHDEMSLYRRVVRRVIGADGAAVHAWTYLYLGDDGQPIPSGDWRARQTGER